MIDAKYGTRIIVLCVTGGITQSTAMALREES